MLADSRWSLPGFLVLGAYAPGAKIQFFCLSGNCYQSRVNIRQRPFVGPALRMADVMPELHGFSANITLQLSSPSEWAF
jgi:hypothetical protein